MRELPSGTVTFLFTDVEGSTRLLHELGPEAYADALAEHRRVLRYAFTRHGGVEVDTQGDAFFVAFATAPGALAAAGELTEALRSGPIRVRVGMHTGTPLLAEEGYVGSDVHRAARIAAAGHGGQVLVSAATATLVGHGGLRDLGEHRLKDLSAAERLYQLGGDEFPRLKTLFQTNLPVPATPFLGRERELAEVSELLARPEVRLLTLTGPGGTGKTRLALQAVAESSDRYPDGVWWVPLAPLREPGLVLAQAAQALGSSGPLSSYVADRRMLLLLDNFEHVLGAAPGVGALVTECPNLDVVVTSRELLQLTGEHAYGVPTLSAGDGASLFLARARVVASELTGERHVGEVCDRLDNLPLAIELAAARTRHLTVEQLLGRLSQRLDLLKGGRDADPRQATLRATIAWSHDLLEPDERRLFAQFSVFAGGCTLEVAEAICEAGLDEISSLVDKSLVRRTGERYWMLETIREFAAERLDDSEQTEQVRRSHAESFLGLAETLGFTVESIEEGAVQRHDVAIAEVSNFRAALDWALEADPVLGLRLATTLENFWVSYSPHDSLRWFDELAERAVDFPPALVALATRCRGNLFVVTGRMELGLQRYQESLDLYWSIGDEHGVAVLEHRLGLNLYSIGERERGRRLLEESLARSRRLGFRINEAMVSGSLGDVDYREGNVEHGLEVMARTVDLARDAGFKWWEANMLGALATYTLELDRPVDAEGYSRAWLALARQMGDRRHAVQALSLLAVLAVGRGDTERAGRLWGAVEAEEQRGPLGRRPRMAEWEAERERFAGIVLADRSSDFEQARAEGRLLSFDEAVEYALDSID